MTEQIDVYGANWCHDTVATLHQLDTLKIPYRYIDVDEDPQAQEWVKQQNSGKQKTPTLNIAGQILVEPDEQELADALRQNGLLT